ncbi:MAG: hypothetical protein GKR98_06170 [Boseongicola sp.]|nr:MAG: hypothetical protein GKR98_06170 [Boseongicola sp.]
MSVVFLCVGAAKAGTTWLHRQLSEHPECHFRTIKELHYFDAVDAGRLEKQLDHHRAMQAEMKSRLSGWGRRPNHVQAARLQDRADWIGVLASGRENTEGYLNYLNTGAGQARVVGEMTPAYALLSEARLAKMAQIASDVRILFLMRDPVERLWSHVRMMAGRRDPQGKVNRGRTGAHLKAHASRRRNADRQALRLC